MRHILAVLAITTIAGPGLSDEVHSSVRANDSSLPWNRAFTVRDEAREEGHLVVSARSSGVAIPANSKWGVTVNLDAKNPSFDNMDRVSAGAYFDLSPRVRLGGSFSFGAPGDLRISTPRDRTFPRGPGENEPAVRIESSIKF